MYLKVAYSCGKVIHNDSLRLYQQKPHRAYITTRVGGERVRQKLKKSIHRKLLKFSGIGYYVI
jgi:hypothetical protein